MQWATDAAPVSKGRLRTGQILSGLAVAFLTFDGVIKLVNIQPVVDSLVQLGYPAHLGLVIGLIELACLIVYVIPRSSVLGAILLTGYLGGGVATHTRIESPLLTHTLFPIYIAALIWGGLFLREVRLRALLPLRS
jgi:hypothetical protein